RLALEPWGVGGYTIPPGTYVGSCLYLAHRRPELWADRSAVKPERFVDAALELREVLRAVAARFPLRPDRAEGERMRRRSLTLAPARGGTVIPDAPA